MPFQSEKQRRYLWANEPEIARDWTDTYGSRIEKNDGGIMRTGFFEAGLAQGDSISPGTSTSGGMRHGPGNIHGGPTVKEALKIGKRKAELKALARNLAKDKREEKVERFRNKKVMNKRTRDFFLDKVLKSSKYGLTAEDFAKMGLSEQEDEYGDYLDARGLGEIDAYGNPLGPQRTGQPISPYPRDVHPGTGGDTTTATDYGFNTDFQDSLTSAATTPDYFVGETPLASNLAWGKKMGADPRTMGLTSWAEGGRIPAAFGGIMDTATGRRAYGLGSIFKSIKKAASKVLKSKVGKAAILAGVGMYGMGAGPWASGGMWANAPGAGFLTGIGSSIGASDIGKKLFMNKAGNLSLGKLAVWGAGALPFFMGGPEEDDEGDKGADYDLLRNKYAQELMNIKRGVSAGSLDPDQWSYLPADYVYKGAEGGRSGFYAGGQSTPSDYTIEDAMMTTTQDKLGGITEAMKRADLYRKGSVGQMYAADGGRIGYDAGGQTGHPPITTGQISQLPNQMPGPQAQRPNPMPAPQPNRMAMNPMMNSPMMNRPMMNPMMARGMNPMMGGRRMAQEGGLMDLGGMEKDYRNDGGFVPLGGEEKADDVPARLSRNEFVFTADAVRGAGGGDIDKGAEIMENVMKNLEEGGQISEETQGLSGAQEMFGVSERLSEVV